jgi:hypothetical protein
MTKIITTGYLALCLVQKHTNEQLRTTTEHSIVFAGEEFLRYI